MDKFELSLIPKKEATEPLYIQCGEGAYALTQHISTTELLEGIQWVVNNCVDDRPFISYALLHIVSELGLAKTFTNISLPEELVNPQEVFDLLEGAEVFEEIHAKADAKQIQNFGEFALKTLLSIIEYKNSARGIIDALGMGAKDNTEAMQENLSFFADEGNLAQVKNLLATAQQMGYTPD